MIWASNGFNGPTLVSPRKDRWDSANRPSERIAADFASGDEGKVRVAGVKLWRVEKIEKCHEKVLSNIVAPYRWAET